MTSQYRGIRPPATSGIRAPTQLSATSQSQGNLPRPSGLPSLKNCAQGLTPENPVEGGAALKTGKPC